MISTIDMKASEESISKNKNYAMLATFLIHVVILAFLLFFIIPVQKEKTPEELEPGGLLVTFGEPDAGFSDEFGETDPTNNPSASAPESAEAPLAQNTAENIVSTSAKPKVAPTKATTTTNNSTAKPNNNVSTSTVEADAAAKAAAAKSKFSGIAKNAGRGTNNSPGNQGTANGDPNGSALDGISKGSGRVGGGLSGRGIEFEPPFEDRSQKTGKVTLSVCVDNNGKVTKADFTQKGSTTADPYLIDLARKTSLKYKFSKSEITSQCGTVTVDFKVQ